MKKKLEYFVYSTEMKCKVAEKKENFCSPTVIVKNMQRLADEKPSST